MRQPLLIKECELSLNTMLHAEPNLAHDIAKLVKGLPVNVHNKIVKLCYDKNEGKLIKEETVKKDVSLKTYGFRIKEDDYVYELTVEKLNNNLKTLNIFKESLKNSDIYFNLKLNTVTKQQLQELNGLPLSLGSFTEHNKVTDNLFDEITYEYNLNKDVNKNAHYVTLSLDEDSLLENYDLDKNFDKQYEVNLDHLLKEVELEL